MDCFGKTKYDEILWNCIVQVDFSERRDHLSGWKVVEAVFKFFFFEQLIEIRKPEDISSSFIPTEQTSSSLSQQDYYTQILNHLHPEGPSIKKLTWPSIGGKDCTAGNVLMLFFMYLIDRVKQFATKSVYAPYNANPSQNRAEMPRFSRMIISSKLSVTYPLLLQIFQHFPSNSDTK